jgi:hypothetical protein
MLKQWEERKAKGFSVVPDPAATHQADLSAPVK